MEDLAYLWTFQENVDELKQKLRYVTYELEMTRNQTNEEIIKGNQHINKLVLMLQSVYKERDEAKSQLTKLQQMLAFNNKTFNIDQLLPTPTFPTTPFSPDTPLLTNFHAIVNSESSNNNNSFSQPIIQSHVSSPSAISSPDSNNNCCITTIQKPVDGATLMVKKLAKGRPVPKQGELLQAVINAGPLLQTLMVAGSLPTWRNPPGLITRQIPPVQIKGAIGGCSRSGGTMGVCPSSMLDFGGASSSSSASCLVGARITPSAVNFHGPTPKRQRLL